METGVRHLDTQVFSKTQMFSIEAQVRGLRRWAGEAFLRKWWSLVELQMLSRNDREREVMGKNTPGSWNRRYEGLSRHPEELENSGVGRRKGAGTGLVGRPQTPTHGSPGKGLELGRDLGL